MQIVCPTCDKKFQLPPEKIPARRFSFACPKCGNPIKVDPGDTEKLKVSELRPAATSGPMEIALDTEQPAAPDPQIAAITPTISTLEPEAGSGSLENSAFRPTGPTLRPADQALLETLSTTALIVCLDVPTNPEVHRVLQHVGMGDIQEIQDLQAAVDYLQTNEAGIVLVLTSKAPPPPCEPLEPLHRLSPEIRRGTFVALMADNVSSLNGQVAFMLQVNCLLSSRDLPRAPQLLLRAVLHHLRLYRHWNIEDS